MDGTGLSLMLFPQRWDGRRLSASLLVLPRGDPLHAPLWAEGAVFAGAPVALQLELQPGGDAFTPGAAGNLSVDFTPPLATRAVELFSALHAQFLPTPPPSNPQALWRWREQRRARWAALGAVRKVLPESYLAALGGGHAGRDALRRAAFLLSEADLSRRLIRSASEPQSAAERHLSWGEVLSHALRQPALARALGLVIDIDTGFTGWDVASVLSQGGWLQLTLAAAQRHRAPGLAVRIPPLGAAPRPLFAAMLFREDADGTEPRPQPWRDEADAYSDGFARVVHSTEYRPLGASVPLAPPPGVHPGLAIGWDDEQVLAWAQRHIDALCSPAEASGLPGVAGYRVDVRERGATHAAWRSLCGLRGTLSVGAWRSDFIGESRIDVAPLIAGHGDEAFAYLPRHFAVWRGGSLVAGSGGAWSAQPWPPDQPLPELHPGSDWEFRVRLVDLSGGGPQLGDQPVAGTGRRAS